MSISKKIICVLMALIFVFSFSACNGNDSEDATTTTTRPKAITATIQDIYNDMHENLVRAENKYGNNVYSFKITVTDIFDTCIFGTLSDETGTLSNIRVLNISTEDILKLSVGGTFVVEGYLEFHNDISGIGFDIVDGIVVG